MNPKTGTLLDPECRLRVKDRTSRTTPTDIVPGRFCPWTTNNPSYVTLNGKDIPGFWKYCYDYNYQYRHTPIRLKVLHDKL